jgi:hypothetical protein
MGNHKTNLYKTNRIKYHGFMTTPKFPTSGQVAGLTQISPMRLYHYVRDFPEFFSEGAKIHKRGRRWSPEDIELVLSIKSLYHDRTGKENIRQLIAQGWRMEKSSFYGREALNALLETAEVYYANAAEVNKTAKALTWETQAMLKTARHDHEAVIKMRAELSELEAKFYNLLQEVRTKRYSLFGPRDTGMHR